MSDFSYRLVVVTHGDHGLLLDETLKAFFEHAIPAPSSILIRFDRVTYDAAEAARTIAEKHEVAVDADFGDAPGFCASTRRAWQAAATGAWIPEILDQFSSYEYVFWLEHDFILSRDVNLAHLARVLDDNEQIAQMALMRGAVNSQEILAGGLFESRRGQYEQHWLGEGGCELAWLEHRAYFTTNPSLMQRSFMQQYPWPDYTEQCEGRFGLDLFAAGLSFGVWGEGEPWCAHAGVRDGFGY